MVQVICTLPNASDNISGVKFSAHPEGVISEDIDQEVADGFLECQGYKLGTSDSANSDPANLASEKEKRAALMARATELGIQVSNRWSNTTLADRVAAAEAEAAAAADAEKADAESKSDDASGDQTAQDGSVQQ